MKIFLHNSIILIAYVLFLFCLNGCKVTNMPKPWNERLNDEMAMYGYVQITNDDKTIIYKNNIPLWSYTRNTNTSMSYSTSYIGPYKLYDEALNDFNYSLEKSEGIQEEKDRKDLNFYKPETNGEEVSK